MRPGMQRSLVERGGEHALRPGMSLRAIRGFGNSANATVDDRVRTGYWRRQVQAQCAPAVQFVFGVEVTKDSSARRPSADPQPGSRTNVVAEWPHRTKKLCSTMIGVDRNHRNLDPMVWQESATTETATTALGGDS